MRCVVCRACWSSWSDEKPSQPRARLYNQESLGSCWWWSSDNPGTSLYAIFLCSLDVLVYSYRMLYSTWASNYKYVYDNPKMMNSTMFSSVQERLQSRRGRKRWKRDFWGPQVGGDHRGKRYFKGSVRGCLVRKRLNPQLLKSPLSIVCECARGISALSLKLPCQDSFRGSFSSCCDSSTSVWKDIPGT